MSVESSSNSFDVPVQSSGSIPRPGSRFGRKNNMMLVLQRRARITDRYIRGETIMDIARDEKLTPGTISRDLSWVREQWLQRALENRDIQVARELAKIDAAEAEFWAAWERSKRPGEITRTERTQSGQVVTKTAIARRPRDGNPMFLQGVLQCVERRCKLLGLDVPNKVDVEDDIRKLADRLGLDPDQAVQEARYQIRLLETERAEYRVLPSTSNDDVDAPPEGES